MNIRFESGELKLREVICYKIEILIITLQILEIHKFKIGLKDENTDL
jgi:hypothetical protein